MALPNYFRKCVGCHNARPKKELLRVVKFKNILPEIDVKQNKPGRGLYFCFDNNCVLLARHNYSIEKSFRCEIDHSCYDFLIIQIEKHGP